ncbi:hypothetical protein MHYP_G00134270 [Metynnis hypsauchen]
MGKGRLLSDKQSPPARAPNQPPSKKQEQQGYEGTLGKKGRGQWTVRGQAEPRAIFSLAVPNETARQLGRKPYCCDSLPAPKLHCHSNNKRGIPSSQRHQHLTPSFNSERFLSTWKFPLCQLTGTMLKHRGVSQEQRCKRGLETGVSFSWRQRQETDGLTFDSFQGEVAVSQHTSAMITAQHYVHRLVKKSILISFANGCGEP